MKEVKRKYTFTTKEIDGIHAVLTKGFHAIQDEIAECNKLANALGTSPVLIAVLNDRARHCKYILEDTNRAWKQICDTMRKQGAQDKRYE